jgi:mRNA degradation ribonuclease J1/J2
VFDASVYRRIGDEGITAMVCDSTNATVEGRSPSEGELYRGLLSRVMAATGRVVVACFGSNVARLTTLARVAAATGRYPRLLGGSLANYYRAARVSELWMLEQELVPAAHLGYLPAQEVFAIATGSQGERGAALSRLAACDHPDLDLEPGDTVILSSRVIPGNKPALAALDARLQAMGINVIHDVEGASPIHASGYPARDELRDMYDWIGPRIAVPVHAEGHHLDDHAELARKLGCRFSSMVAMVIFSYSRHSPAYVAVPRRLAESYFGVGQSVPAVPTPPDSHDCGGHRDPIWPGRFSANSTGRQQVSGGSMEVREHGKAACPPTYPPGPTSW